MDRREQAALEAFGRLLMERGRDWAITDLDAILEGKMPTREGTMSRQGTPLFNTEQMAVLRWLVVESVDHTIHHVLWALEQTPWIDIAVHTPEGRVDSLREVSDGLAGDGVGWIEEYSKQRQNSGGTAI